MSVEFSLGALGTAVGERIGKLAGDSVAARIRDRDPTVWTDDPGVLASIGNRLGWLNALSGMRSRLDEVRGAVREIRSSGFTHAVLLGMGGSSLCPEVLRKTFGVAEGFLDVQVLDSTDPASVMGVEERVELGKTIFVVASKSGGTTEVQAFQKYFASRVGGDRFIAITDPGTALAELAEKENYRHTFLNPPDIGGRFSALSLFGLVPAALLGIDLDLFLSSAERMADACGSGRPAGENPGVQLGALLGEAALHGRDKLTFFFSPEIAPLGSWIEQLVAESTGKEGRGILPIDGEPPLAPDEYGDDRLFILVSLEGPAREDLSGKAASLEAAGHPVVRINLSGKMDLGGEFYRWEMATAVCGVILGINPFDEPNVKESKEITRTLLDEFGKRGAFGKITPRLEESGIELFADENLAVGDEAGLEGTLGSHFDRAKAGDYLAVLAYIQPTAEHREWLETIRRAAGSGRKNATTLGVGPRFLHSTGQFHKGGPNTGLFLQITCEDPVDLPIPGWTFGFSTLKNAQALGDYQALLRHGRRVVRCHITGDPATGLKNIAKALGN